MQTTCVKGKLVAHTRGLVLALCFLLWLEGCHSKCGESAFGLRTANLRISGSPLTAEVADTPQALENGFKSLTIVPEQQSGERIVELACDYVIVEDEAGGSRTRLPVHYIHQIQTPTAPTAEAA